MFNRRANNQNRSTKKALFIFQIIIWAWRPIQRISEESEGLKHFKLLSISMSDNRKLTLYSKGGVPFLLIFRCMGTQDICPLPLSLGLNALIGLICYKMLVWVVCAIICMCSNEQHWASTIGQFFWNSIVIILPLQACLLRLAFHTIRVVGYG